MKLIRITNPGGLDQIREYLQPDESFGDIDNLIQELKLRLQESPDSAYYSVGIDEESDLVLGYVLAFSPQLGIGVLYQSWFKPENDKTKDLLFKRLLLWCDQHDIKQLQAKVGRNSEQFIEEKGFSVISKIYGLDVEACVNALLTTQGSSDGK